MKQVKFTVAIPTYNGEKRLPKVLDKLREQINTEHFDWEILVVDNNSKDSTAEIVKNYQKNWSEAYDLRYYFEVEQGAAFARQRAIREAKTELVGFLDDDVIPASDWVAAAYEFGQKYPQAGAFGGQIHGDFEVPPPENFKRIQSFLAIRERGLKAHLYSPEKLILPPSASWVIRKKAWLDNVPSRPTLGGRAKGSMIQGDDYEPLLYMHKAGWEIWYNPEMQVAHHIPKSRLEKDYLISLIRGSCLCICYLRMIGAKTWEKPFIMVKIMLGSLKRTIQHIVKYKWQVRTDLIASCEMEFYLSSFASPFYFLKTLLLSRRLS
ncbi:MAG: glycosyltransferase family 2 protein [Okeania sp. SIO3I5]|uniref:hormogonium polysaccharide biosynthesis glycosyltransferase HpsE n=1 Tax=Okeania sp. SIO3I5 TaxID=2607805 RepID=UPI0013BB56A8|nr:hormogonium polysaccharide biosynthesis glycosyltransferase HpsE [Okeania sp. SIO3I5]NEQ40041.1 glycosyltransferase family 2 protein [Okeania sp. SIO3I5]